MNVLFAAQAGEVDDIVEEAELRQRLISAVLMLSGKAASAPKRRHANMPL
jgi:acetyl-CoA carboxylase carboxyltransferase component